MKVGGQWWFHYGYYSNNLLVQKDDTGKHADRTVARQRMRTQIQFIADENLSAMLNLEANMHWGDTANSGTGNTHGGLDADNATFVIKRAHLDWTLPGTQVQTRMGMQGIAMPSVAFGNPVMNADVAGISVSSQITPELGLTVFWARPYDRNYYDSDTQSKGQNELDEMDMFGFMLPVRTDVVRFTPWGMFAFIGRDSGFYGTRSDKTKGTWKSGVWTANDDAYNSYNYNRGQRKPDLSKMDSTTYGWWLGTTFELPVLDPFFVKLDAMMGGLETGESDYDTFGWMVAADIGYKFSWGALSAIGFYSSGDDDDDDLGQLPIVSEDGGFLPTRYATGGTTARSYDGLLTRSGQGLWGVGVKLADVSFVDNLKHTVIGMYYGGTNEGDSWANKRGVADGPKGFQPRFSGHSLMTSDHAWEINLLNEYTVNQYLKFNIDFAYVDLELGDHWKDKNDTKGSFATMIGVTYSF